LPVQNPYAYFASLPFSPQTFNSPMHVGDLRFAHEGTKKHHQEKRLCWTLSHEMHLQLDYRHVGLNPCLLSRMASGCSATVRFNCSAAAKVTAMEWERAAACVLNKSQGTYRCVIFRGAKYQHMKPSLFTDPRRGFIWSIYLWFTPKMVIGSSRKKEKTTGAVSAAVAVVAAAAGRTHTALAAAAAAPRRGGGGGGSFGIRTSSDTETTKWDNSLVYNCSWRSDVFILLLNKSQHWDVLGLKRETHLLHVFASHAWDFVRENKTIHNNWDICACAFPPRRSRRSGFPAGCNLWGTEADPGCVWLTSPLKLNDRITAYVLHNNPPKWWLVKLSCRVWAQQAVMFPWKWFVGCWWSRLLSAPWAATKALPRGMHGLKAGIHSNILSANKQRSEY